VAGAHLRLTHARCTYGTHCISRHHDVERSSKLSLRHRKRLEKLSVIKYSRLSAHDMLEDDAESNRNAHDRVSQLTGAWASLRSAHGSARVAKFLTIKQSNNQTLSHTGIFTTIPYHTRKESNKW
jgi:hypothetical protein